MRNLTVIIPTYNEAKAIKPLLFDLSYSSHPELAAPTILIVDDGNDGMKKINKGVLENIKVIRGGKGESESVYIGIKTANTDLVAIMDADGSHRAEDLYQMYHRYMELTMGPPIDPIIVGSRYIDEGKTKGKFLNKIFSKTGNWMLRKFLGLKTRDLTGRFLLGSRNALLTSDVWYGKGDAGIALIHYWEKQKDEHHPIIEVPIEYNPRLEGTGQTVSLKGLIKFSGLYSLRLLSLFLHKRVYLSDRFIAQGLAKDETGNQNTKVTYKHIALNILSIPFFYGLTFFTYIFPFSKFLVCTYPQSISGYILRLAFYKHRLKECGKDVLIDRNVAIWDNKKTILKDGVRLDSNVQIKSGPTEHDYFVAEERVSIHQNTILNAKGGIYLEKESCIGANCAIYASTNTPDTTIYNEVPSFSYAAKIEDQSINRGSIRLGIRSYIGPNSVIVSTVIANSSIIAPHSFLINDYVYAREIWAGQPARKIKDNFGE